MKVIFHVSFSLFHASFLQEAKEDEEARERRRRRAIITRLSMPDEIWSFFLSAFNISYFSIYHSARQLYSAWLNV